MFVYTKDTNYANGESFRDGGVFYKRNGVYKYTTTMGGTNSVPVMSPAKYRIADIAGKLEKFNENIEAIKIPGDQENKRKEMIQSYLNEIDSSITVDGTNYGREEDEFCFDSNLSCDRKYIGKTSCEYVNDKNRVCIPYSFGYDNND